MKRSILAFLLIPSMLFFPANLFARENLEKEHFARWHINYASYLIDVGKYMEALECYETSFESSSIAKTKIDALIAKATLLSAFLDANDEALKVFRKIRTAYPRAAEIAHYREGLLLFELNRFKDAENVLSTYLRSYGSGRFRYQAEALLQAIKKAIAPPPLTPSRPKNPEVRVRICKAARDAIIKGGSICVKGLGCKDNYKIEASKGQILLAGVPVNEKRITFESKSPMEITCGTKKKMVRGLLTAKLKETNLLIINIINIEDYLRSVVPSESYASWPLETLKAQAVAARTYAYYQLLHRKNWAYDLVDDEGDQAYKGMERERKKTSRAVEETSGEILTFKGRPILAMYSANSGGHTADAKAIFSLRKPYLSAHPDPESLKGKMARWTKQYPTHEIETALQKIGIKIGDLSGIEPAETGPSGRIVKVRIISREGTTKKLRTRTTLGRALKLPEILLQIKTNGDLIEFQGNGWGHGVGYSQWGAAYLGKTEKYNKILEFYYPGVTLERVW